MLFLLTQTFVMVGLHQWQSRFFYVDDKLFQYLPAFGWLGDQAGWAPPLIDPDQGMGGAFIADLQNGVLDPVHWLISRLVAGAGDLNLAAWGLHLTAVGVLGLGVAALASAYGVRPLWAAAAALGAANGGFLLWFGASWWPAAWGTAWLPWLWWGLVTTSRWGWVGVLSASYLLATSGYPYVVPFAGLVVLGVMTESRIALRAWRAVLGKSTGRLIAGWAGFLLAAPGLFAASALKPYTWRAEARRNALGNIGELIPNLVDVVLGGATTSGVMAGWWGEILPPPVFSGAWFALPAVAFVQWGKARRGRGVLTAAVLLGAGVMATQLPTDVGPFRYPMRHLAIVQLALPVLVVLLLRVGLAVSARRVAAASALAAAQGLLAWARTPVNAWWHIGVALVGVTCLLVAFAWHGRSSRAPAFGVVALGLTALAPLAGVGAAVALDGALARAGGREPSELPARGLNRLDALPHTVGDFRDRAWDRDLNATALIWGDKPDGGFASGVYVGSISLLAGNRLGYGYAPLGQVGWAQRWGCQDHLGQTGRCSQGVERFLGTVPGTGLPWLEVLSKDILLLDRSAPAPIRAALDERWELVGQRRGYDRLERRRPAPGRLTWVPPQVTSVRAEHVGFERERYRLAWQSDAPVRIVTRIPWWPGYQASLDGVPVPVTSVEDTVVAVDLPSGQHRSELEIWFSHPRASAAKGAVALGGLAAVAAGLIEAGAFRRLRRSRRHIRAPRFSAPMVRFVGVGAATVAIDAAAYQALLASGTESAAAKAASFVTGAFFAYFANWRFTFGERRHARWAPVAFAAVYGCALALNTGVNEAVLGVLGDDDRLSVTAAFLVATAVSATWNFLGMSRFVFSSPPTRAEPEWPTIDPTARVTPPE